MRTTGYSVAKSKILFIRFSYLFGSVLTVLLKIRYLKLFYGIFVYYSLLKFRLNTIFCQFLKARVFFLVRLPPLAVLDCACFQNQHIPKCRLQCNGSHSIRKGDNFSKGINYFITLALEI